jgi:hypothetical protein
MTAVTIYLTGLICGFAIGYGVRAWFSQRRRRDARRIRDYFE